MARLLATILMELLFKKLDKLPNHKVILTLVLIVLVVDIFYVLFIVLIFTFIKSLGYISDDLILLLFGDDELFSPFSEFISLVFIAPLFETLIFQMPLYWFISRFTKNLNNLVVIITLVFSAIHVFNGLIAVLGTLPGSFILSITYIYYRRASLSKAYWYTVLMHAIGNFYTWLIIIWMI